MLEQGHVIDPDSQQASLLWNPTFKVVDLYQINMFLHGMVSKNLPLSRVEVVGMIRPMNGDFEFFDPIPLPAASPNWICMRQP